MGESLRHQVQKNDTTTTDKLLVTGVEKLAYLFVGIVTITVGGLVWFTSESRKLRRKSFNIAHTLD